MIAPRYRSLSAPALATITDPCGACGYGFSTGSGSPDGVEAEPAVPDWVQEVADLWGLCGIAAHINGDVPGYLTMAPAELVPSIPLPAPGGSSADVFSAEAAVVTAVAVCRDHRGRGLARNLVRAAIGQLAKRQVGMVEAIGTYGLPGVPHADGADASIVLLPVAFWQTLGFRIVRPHPFTPTLRLDVAGTVRWRPDFAAAWQRLTDLVAQPGTAQPGPAQPAGFRAHRELTIRKPTPLS